MTAGVTIAPLSRLPRTRLTSFETLAGDPPNVAAMMIRAHQLAHLERLPVLWDGWHDWFAELRESHTALPAVAFLGSSRWSVSPH